VEVCKFYMPMVDGVNWKTLPYGVCKYDDKVVNCKNVDYKNCSTFKCLNERIELSGGLERKIK